MRPQWQQQQQQQQQQWQQHQAGGYYQQQKEKQKRQEEARRNQLRQSQMKTGDKFTQVEVDVVRLKRDFSTGLLTEAQYKAKLQELMVKDERGIWWMMNADTMDWYCNSGDGWMRANPPGMAAKITSSFNTGTRKFSPHASSPGQGQHYDDTNSSPRLISTLGSLPHLARWAFVSIGCLFITIIAGLLIGSLVGVLTDNSAAPLLIAVPIWVIGIIITLLISKGTWEDK